MDDDEQVSVNAKNVNDIDEVCIQTYNTEMAQFNWKTFEDFKECILGIWRLNCSIFNDDWSEISFTCPVYMKKYLCKHSLGK